MKPLDAVVLAIKTGDFNTVRRLVSWVNVDMPVDRSGATLLILAARYYSVSVVQVLLDEGANPNTYQKVSGRISTPLMLTAEYDRPEIARLLLSRSADINAEDESGGTALSRALFFVHPVMAELFLDAGARIDANSAELRTALLHYFRISGNRKLVGRIDPENRFGLLA